MLEKIAQSAIYRKPPQLDEALRFYTFALALRSRSPAIHYDLGNVLYARGRLDEAIARYRQTLQLDPNNVRAHINLGNALRDAGQLDEAFAHHTQALQLDPGSAAAHIGLGNFLLGRGQVDEAIAHYDEAIRLDPKGGLSHLAVGVARLAKGQRDEAIAAFKEAIRLQPNLAEAHKRLGLTLYQQNRMDEAAEALKEAVRVKPDFAEAHLYLGVVFIQQGRLDDAIIACREAMRLEPNKPSYAQAYGALGIALENAGRLDDGLAAYRESLRLQPDSADLHGVLAAALRKKGEFAESLDEFRRAHELALKTRPESPQTAQWVREAERLVELDAKLPALLDGEDKPADAAECLELVNVCLLKKLPAATAQFFEAAFLAKPALAEDLKAGHRYNAACMAALAGCGRGHDALALNKPARAHWRQQALAWLRADLALWSRQMASDKPEGRAAARQALVHWQRDADLAGLREEASLAKLPETEREACRQLWARVQAVLDEARGQR
jgi:tetratricopeptide (TPR) repeat protein